MTIACFVSGSGTNYRELAGRDPSHNYIVFTNRPGCGAVAIARGNGHTVIELSHIPYLKGAKSKYGPGGTPRNCPERVRYEQEACRLIEEKTGGKPDLLCLAGYDQWVTDWMVDRYYPSILNVHPGDTTRGYDGLHWLPSAKAILGGEKEVRSTLFLVDKGEDTGPVLVQSRPLNIVETLQGLEAKGNMGLRTGLCQIIDFAGRNAVRSYEDFRKTCGVDLSGIMERICTSLQEALKVAGDWEIYPFAVHDLIARGRVEVDGRTVYVDGRQLPAHGYRMDANPPRKNPPRN